MRVNVYSEELSDNLVLVVKPRDDQMWYGIRVYLEGQSDVDERSAITLWIGEQDDITLMQDVARQIYDLANEVEGLRH